MDNKGARLEVDFTSFDRMYQAMKNFEGNTMEVISDVLHKDASPLIQKEIKRLMPVSGRTWNGKRNAAQHSKSLTDEKGPLSVTVKTTKNYQYLYFPDDGTNTRRHVGNQQFFLRGGEAEKEEIIERCIARLTEDFEI